MALADVFQRRSSRKVASSPMNIYLSSSARTRDFTKGIGSEENQALYIMRYGLAIKVAEMLKGMWVLETDGTMKRGRRRDTPTYQAELDIDEPSVAIQLALLIEREMIGIFEKEVAADQTGAHFHLKDGGLFHIISLSKNKMTVR